MTATKSASTRPAPDDASSTTDTTGTMDTTVSAARQSTAFTVLVGLSALTVLLQGLWAGIFLEHDGRRDAASGWVEVHARGGEVALVFAAAATVVAFVRLRDRRDLWIASLAFTLLLVLESYLGGLIRDAGKDVLTAVHVPLAMALMGLAVWLPMRARRRP